MDWPLALVLIALILSVTAISTTYISVRNPSRRPPDQTSASLGENGDPDRRHGNM
ncbi:hypothetical protein QNA24_25710 [Rhodococcus qingshengii]|uniref:hypothetical protein n=1 Tax=Rhodococcus qingshengii TaxID=334542 RepID=UPI0024BA1E6E|nr:hypothetical protein [Rhodococcus qingshengii]MDJ0489780.1 hypothetical protein [Rhodococcus qingshengii]